MGWCRGSKEGIVEVSVKEGPINSGVPAWSYGVNTRGLLLTSSRSSVNTMPDAPITWWGESVPLWGQRAGAQEFPAAVWWSKINSRSPRKSPPSVASVNVSGSNYPTMVISATKKISHNVKLGKSPIVSSKPVQASSSAGFWAQSFWLRFIFQLIPFLLGNWFPLSIF